MKRSFMLLVMAVGLLASPSVVPQTTRAVLDPQKVFITSSFDCYVYWGRKRIAILRKGTRAQILRSTKIWILVRYWDGRKNVTGWIKR